MSPRPALVMLLSATSVVSLLFAGLSLYWYYGFCASIEFNELGRHFDEATSTVFTDNNCFAGALTLALSLASAGAAFLSWRCAAPIRKVHRVFLSVLLACSALISGLVVSLWR